MQNSIIQNNNIYINGQDIYLGNKKLPRLPYKSSGLQITTINNRIYVNGYEWYGCRWKVTFRAMWYYILGLF